MINSRILRIKNKPRRCNNNLLLNNKKLLKNRFAGLLPLSVIKKIRDLNLKYKNNNNNHKRSISNTNLSLNNKCN
jgi:hypothetical protein